MSLYVFVGLQDNPTYRTALLMEAYQESGSEVVYKKVSPGFSGQKAHMVFADDLAHSAQNAQPTNPTTANSDPTNPFASRENRDNTTLDRADN